ncbi:unnamed protein product [Dicrocoelium dendriticum]|nr:unnamed protein product [Dicrocoelium dendriticum]
MDCNILWSTPRGQLHSSLSRDCPNLSGIALNTTPIKIDGGAPKIRTDSPISRQNADVRTTPRLCSYTLGRPCIAGTQTTQHQANLTMTNRAISNTDLADSGSLHGIIQDSSGFGSLITDSSDITNSSLPSCSGTGDGFDQWTPPCQPFQGENNTNVLNLDRNELDDIQEPHISPEGAGYMTSTVATKLADSQLRASPTNAYSAMKRGAIQLGDSGVVCNDSASATFSGSVHETRMLEENLASVARYVEELTGCAGTSGTKPSKLDCGRPSQQHLEHSPQISTNEVYTSLARRLQQQQQSHHDHLRQLVQLQQLSQQLATLAARKNVRQGEQATSGSLSTQEPILRLLANQYPELVMKNSALPQELKTGKLKPQPNYLTKQDTEYLIRNNIQANTTQNTTATIGAQSYPGNVQTYLNDGAISNDPGRRAQEIDRLIALVQNPTADYIPILSPNVMGDASTSSSQLPCCKDLEVHTPHLADQLSVVNANTVALLASLLGTGQQQEMASEEVEEQNDVHQAVSNTLNCLLSSFQDHGRARQVRDQALHSSKLTGETRDITNCTSVFQQHSTSNLCKELAYLAAPYQRLLRSLENDIDRAANLYRNSASAIAQKSEAAYHWSGRLPVRIYRSMTFSRKVFLGGVPWDSTTEDLLIAFARFGTLTVSWPQQEGNHLFTARTKSTTPRGYCYLIFEHESSVSELIAACVRDPTTGGDYYKISSATFKSKDVQVIPWVISDSQYTKAGPYRPDSKRTVFIGALHGMITAEALVTIMNDLFGNVVFAALDTDKYKYPIGKLKVSLLCFRWSALVFL